MPATRDLAGRFVKGQSGNPKGQSKKSLDWRDTCRAFMEAKGWKIAEGLATKAGPDQLRTLMFLADHGYGKPSQTLIHQGDEEKPVAITTIEVNKG